MNFKHLHYFWKVATTGAVARASEELHITPQTISEQIQLLEEELGTALFARQGRRLELTEAGRLALGYAQEIFSLGAELRETLQFHGRGRRIGFRVGVADAVPKTLAHRLLEPAMGLPEGVRIVCREWKLDSLLSELAVHRLDLVIADSPVPPAVSVRAYNHRLGESGVSFFAAAALARRLGGDFPACLDGAPMLMPGEDSALRIKLLRWFEGVKVKPDIVGEFDDSALMNAFGQAGIGVFPAPSALEREIEAQHDVRALGRTREVVSEFFAISIERRLTHPAVVAITRAARHRFDV